MHASCIMNCKLQDLDFISFALGTVEAAGVNHADSNLGGLLELFVAASMKRLLCASIISPQQNPADEVPVLNRNGYGSMVAKLCAGCCDVMSSVSKLIWLRHMSIF